MRTARLSLVDRLLGRECLPRRGCLPTGVGVCPGGICPGGRCLSRGSVCQGRCLPRGGCLPRKEVSGRGCLARGVSAQGVCPGVMADTAPPPGTKGRPPPPRWTDRHQTWFTGGNDAHTVPQNGVAE